MRELVAKALQQPNARSTCQSEVKTRCNDCNWNFEHDTGSLRLRVELVSVPS